MDKKIEINDFALLGCIMQDIKNKYEESKIFFENNLKNQYKNIEFSTVIKENEIEIFHIYKQVLPSNITKLIKYSFIKKDLQKDWIFENKILNKDFNELNIKEINSILENLPTLQKIELVNRAKNKRSNNIRMSHRIKDFNPNIINIKEDLYQKYFSLKNKFLVNNNDINQFKYKIMGDYVQFFISKDLFKNNKKIGEIIIESTSNVINEREVIFEIKFDKGKISSYDHLNQFILRNNRFMKNLLPNFTKIMIEDNDLIYNYYKNNKLTFSRNKLNLEELRDCFYDSVAAIPEQAKSIIKEELEVNK